MLDTVDFEFLLGDSLDGKWGKGPQPLDIQISQGAGKGGGDQVFVTFSAKSLADAGAEGLAPHYLRVNVLANKLAGIYDDLAFDFDLWGKA